MEVKLIQNANGTVVGYQLCAETKKEHETLLQVRNLHMYEESDSPVTYDGMQSSDRYPDLVQGVSFLTLDAMKERDNEIAKKMATSVQTRQAIKKLKELGMIQRSENSFTMADKNLRDVELQVVKKVRPYKKRN